MPIPAKLTSAIIPPSSQCPFLYQTRTILRHHSQPRLTRCRSSAPSPVPRKADVRSLDNDGDHLQGSPSFLKQKASQVASNKSKGRPSITPSEQAAFKNIRALFDSPPTPTPKPHASSADHIDTNYKNILNLFSQPKQTQNDHWETPTEDDADDLEIAIDYEAEPLFQRASVDSNTITPQAFTQGLELNRGNPMIEMQEFLKDTATSTSQSRTDIVHATSLTIVEDVAQSLKEALQSTTLRADMAMWQVSEQKIFPLIKLLGPSTPPSLSSPFPSQQQPRPQGQPIHPLIPPSTPLLPLLSQIYPALTLLVLRLYALHHPTSPYPLALLPTIKSLGPTSYVLGAHTHFYNTLLSLHWQIYSDLRGMGTLLAEMDANGVEFNLGTWEILKGLNEDRLRDLRGEASETARGQVWWDRIEQRLWWEKIGVEWRDRVKRSLEANGVWVEEFMRVEEGGGQRSQFGGQRISSEKGVKSEYVVTL